jgi:glycosyltransferase involved in cell wall biosynthesis
MKNNNKLVSVIIPTKNYAGFLKNCLASIKAQTYKDIEIIIIDREPDNETLALSKKYHAVLYRYSPNLNKGIFDAPYKRNYGVKKAKGVYVYYVDSDMELDKNLIKEAVDSCNKKFDAIILPEDSFGIGIWAKAKNLERRCYWGDTGIEAPRFFKKSVWVKVGGLDQSLASGRDDGDLFYKLLENGYNVGRTKSIVRHNEGELSISNLFKKKFRYGKDVLKYVSKRPRVGIYSYSPLRMSYLRNWKMFLSRPIDSFFFIIMKVIESSGGLMGIAYSLIIR